MSGRDPAPGAFSQKRRCGTISHFPVITVLLTSDIGRVISPRAPLGPSAGHVRFSGVGPAGGVPRLVCWRWSLLILLTGVFLVP